MRTLNHVTRSFRTQVALLVIGAMLITALLSDLLIYRLALNAQFDQLREQLVMVAKTAALAVDPALVSRIPLSSQGADTPEFRSVANKLLAIKKANPKIRYIYTMAMGDREGMLRFIADPDALAADPRRKLSLPGRPYDATRIPEMSAAFFSAQADRALVRDGWGVTLSGYAPIPAPDGAPMAILGVDMAADDVYALQRNVHTRAAVVLLLSVVMSLFLAATVSRRIAQPIKRLVEGTRHIGREEIYSVKVDGAEEIKELAESFNDMAVNLFKSRRRLHTYFYRSVQALVRIMEARDKYTKGHSERVAEYAARIAHCLQMPPEQVELLRETAVLHDIGKLGIEERILNKRDRLTPEDWDTIRKHPIIGEDILAPILLNKELLSVVRSHHERYDGSGYPDKLSGSQIKLFAQILAVADSFDAMTSPRSYRPAMPAAKAVDELRRHRGSQFSPHIVDVFIELLNDEGRRDRPKEKARG